MALQVYLKNLWGLCSCNVHIHFSLQLSHLADETQAQETTQIVSSSLGTQEKKSHTYMHSYVFQITEQCG